jgi:hypothetical protein
MEMRWVDTGNAVQESQTGNDHEMERVVVICE